MDRHFMAGPANDVIKTALQAGVIKLSGPTGTEEGSKAAAKNDAAYLLTLLNQLMGPKSEK